MAELEKIAGFGKVEFPKKRSDTAGYLKIFLKMEQHAIQLYSDLVTHELAEDLLAEEVAEEEEYENMLRE